MLEADDDWPDVPGSMSDLLKVDPDQLRAWVNASPRRAFSGDGEYLWLARRRQPDTALGAINSPPDPGTPGLWSVDVFAPTFWSCFVLHPDVKVLSLAWNEDGFDLTLHLPQDLSAELGLESSQKELHLPPNPFRVIDQGGKTPQEQHAALVKLLEAGGVSSQTLKRAARERRKQERREKKEFQALKQQATACYLQAADASGRYGVPDDRRSWWDRSKSRRRLLHRTLKRHGLRRHAANLARLTLPAYRLDTTDHLRLEGGQQAGSVDHRRHLAGLDVDADDAVLAPDVGIELTFGELKLVELLDRNPGVNDLEGRPPAEVGGISERQERGSVRHHQVLGVIVG